MKYSSIIDKTTIRCELCSHHCHISLDKFGICGVEQNINQELVCVVDNKISALNIDPVEKKPLYHFLPNSKTLSLGTVGCNFRCPFCQNWQLSQSKNIIKEQNITPQKIISKAKEYKIESIAYTYNEPTIFYPFAKKIGLLAKEEGIKNIFVSNGNQSEDLIEDMKEWVDAINVDLKSFDDRYYKTQLKGSLKSIKRNLINLSKSDIWLEITSLLIPDINDSDQEIENMANFIKDECADFTPWHISAFHADYKMLNTNSTSPKRLFEAKKIGQNIGLKNIYLGNIGITNSTICSNCGEVVIKRENFNTIFQNHNRGFCKNCNTKVEGVFL